MGSVKFNDARELSIQLDCHGEFSVDTSGVFVQENMTAIINGSDMLIM
jgi:hypothetical protein